MRKRSQSAGPGKFDKKMGKEDSFDQVTRDLTKLPFQEKKDESFDQLNCFSQITLLKDISKMNLYFIFCNYLKERANTFNFCQGGEGEVAETAGGGGERRGRV